MVENCKKKKKTGKMQESIIKKNKKEDEVYGK